VLETIQKSAEFLSKKDVESPRLQAELLLAHVLKLPRMKLYLNFEKQLKPAETDTMRELVKRRGQREPLQYIVGSTSFCGLEIAVNRHVLIPRPETELLAEAGWQFLSTLCSLTRPDGHPLPSDGRGAGGEGGALEFRLQRASGQPEGWTPTALDFGTGSGCIAIALAVKCPSARICAMDVSREALSVARQNAMQNGVEGRIEFLEGSSFGDLPVDARFDLIISNPPYIPGPEVASLQPEVRDFEPPAALSGGEDGLDFYRMFAAQAAARLRQSGRIMVELGSNQESVVRQIFTGQKWIVEAVGKDYTQHPRTLVARQE
jgi:release factor glutamine methyltransferase